jgi:hypothetical protein
MTGNASLPDGFNIKTADWHFDKLTEFTEFKQAIGEPSPHLTVVGYLCKNLPVMDRVWLIGCYAATYCLPTAQVIFNSWKYQDIRDHPDKFKNWLTENWKGIVTRTERRAVRSVPKFYQCITTYIDWMETEFPRLQKLRGLDPVAMYDTVWDSVTKNIYSFGRYISIRMIEGLRRYCDIPAQLYDLRSIGGWSPKKCLCYLYPDDASTMLKDDALGNKITNEIFENLLMQMRDYLPKLDYYVLAAMLCEYKGAYENRHQYVGWTIDQEPLLYDKIIAYWGNTIDTHALWEARTASFPIQVLGEKGDRWNGTRWDLAKVLRDYGYNWTDMKYNYMKTLESGDFSKPIPWKEGDVIWALK